MNKITKKILSIIIISMLVLTIVSTLDLLGVKRTPEITSAESTQETTVSANATPKYIFLFIGDGMSYPQIQLTSDYLGILSQKENALNQNLQNKNSLNQKSQSQNSQNLNSQNQGNDILAGNEYLPFMNFPVAGSLVTYDSTSFCPDSASAATSIATGNKTYSSTINMDETKTITYETIAEKLKKQLDYKIGIITTVNLNHATPAAFYAHQPSRNNFYEIGLELMKSGYDYFAGGALINPTGDNKANPQDNLYDIAVKHGYKVIKSKAEAQKLDPQSEKSIVIAEDLDESGALSYALDSKSGQWNLKDYVKKGIQVLDNETGFFIMVEGGKIDWAGHGNDAASVIAETQGFSSAIDEAINFYKKHPTETLILVTGDHETGGLTIGYAGTDYDTHLENLSHQKISAAKFNSIYIPKYKKNRTSFKTVLKDIKNNFGLVTKSDKSAGKYPDLVLTDYEYSQLKTAYNKTIDSKHKTITQKEYIQYGTLEPLTITITHLLSNKSGINFSSYSHSGLPVPIFAQGAGAVFFDGYKDNREIYANLTKLLSLK